MEYHETTRFFGTSHLRSAVRRERQVSKWERLMPLCHLGTHGELVQRKCHARGGASTDDTLLRCVAPESKLTREMMEDVKESAEILGLKISVVHASTRGERQCIVILGERNVDMEHAKSVLGRLT